MGKYEKNDMGGSCGHAPSWRNFGRAPRSTQMAPASRMAARLADLSHAQLLEIATAGCEASAEVKNRADVILAAHKPLAQWAVEGVLLSSDLVPHLLAPPYSSGVRLPSGSARRKIVVHGGGTRGRRAAGS